MGVARGFMVVLKLHTEVAAETKLVCWPHGFFCTSPCQTYSLRWKAPTSRGDAGGKTVSQALTRRCVCLTAP